MYKDKDKQRQANKEQMRRARAKGNTKQDNTEQGNTNLEQCQYCGKPLPKLQAPRQHPGACYECAINQPAKPVSPSSEGHILSSRPALEYTGTMTGYEHTNYKTKAELDKGQYNPVSKPGDEHYGVFKKG